MKKEDGSDGSGLVRKAWMASARLARDSRVFSSFSSPPFTIQYNSMLLLVAFKANRHVIFFSRKGEFSSLFHLLCLALTVSCLLWGEDSRGQEYTVFHVIKWSTNSKQRNCDPGNIIEAYECIKNENHITDLHTIHTSLFGFGVLIATVTAFVFHLNSILQIRTSRTLGTKKL